MRGKVRFTVGEAEHVLHFTVNRLCDLEEETGESVMHYAEALGQPGAIGLRDVRRLMRFGLGSTEAEAGDIVQEIGLQRSVALIGEALAAAFDIDLKPEGGAGKKAAGAA